MNILSSQQLKQADAATLASRQISSWQLMEHAAAALFDSLRADVDIYACRFAIFCGPGNNGGDGLALARMIHSSGGEAEVFLFRSDSYSEDNLQNQERLGALPLTVFDLHSRLAFQEGSIIIDALFGYGLNRLLDPAWAFITDQINASGKRVFSVDMPSGLLADTPTAPGAPVIKARRVYTFHSPKKALLLPENASRAEDFKVIPIGLEDRFHTPEQYITAGRVKNGIKRPSRFSHKGTFGHVLISGGSYGKVGAVILAARAALRTGCGLVTAYVPRCAYTPLQTAVPEAMVMTDTGEEHLKAFPSLMQAYSSLGLGIGMGTSEETATAFLRFLQTTDLPPLVLDADALNLLSQNRVKIPPKAILTPHPKELERIMGPWTHDFEKLEMGKRLSRELDIILVIKGANSAIIFPDGTVSFNSTGNYGMAKGGSGDVLTGVIASLLAQGYPPEQAAITGVFLHGLAGDLAAELTGPRGMTAGDIVNALPAAWKQISDA